MRSGRRPAARSAAPPADLPEDICEILNRSDTDALDELREIAAGPDRERAKSARKALFRLGARPQPAQEAPPAHRPQQAAHRPAADTALVTLSDAGGKRLIVFARGDDRPPCWGFIEDWQKGIVMAEALPRTVRDIVDNMAERAVDERTPGFARLAADEARQVLDRAARWTRSAGGFLPAGYTKCRQAVGGDDRSGAEPPIYARVGPASVLSSSPLLLDRVDDERVTILPAWLLREPAIQDLATRTAAALDTRIVLPERQQADVALRLVTEAAPDLLPPERIEALCSRMETDALVLWHNGNRDVAEQTARRARAGRAAARATDWPFAMSLIAGSVRALLAQGGGAEDEPPRRTPESLIVRP